MIYYFKRGFVWKVECTLQFWCGVECPARGALAHRLACCLCHGTGRVNAHGPALVKAAPLERVTLTDCSPVDFAGLAGYHSCWAWQPPLPRCLSDRIPIVNVSGNLNPPGFSSKELAEAHLSHACLAWARAQPAPPLASRSFTS